MNERRNLFVGAAEDLRNPARVIRVSCRKPHKGRLYLSPYSRDTHTLTRKRMVGDILSASSPR